MPTVANLSSANMEKYKKESCDRHSCPKRILNEHLTSGPAANQKIDFEEFKRSYFAAMSWDIKTGKADKKALEEAGLADLVFLPFPVSNISDLQHFLFRIMPL